jgi:hypothetical protein
MGYFFILASHQVNKVNTIIISLILWKWKLRLEGIKLSTEDCKGTQGQSQDFKTACVTPSQTMSVHQQQMKATELSALLSTSISDLGLICSKLCIK